MSDFVLFDEEFHQIKDVIGRLKADAQAKVVFIVDKNGQQIAAMGDMDTLDTPSLASLTAGNVAATDGLARLIGEREIPVIFDERSSLGLVRLRVRKANTELERIFETIQKKVESEKVRRQEGFDSPFAEITDEDIDSLFRE